MKYSTSTLPSRNISIIGNPMEGSALNDNRSYSFFLNESTSTSYFNDSPTVYSNKSSTSYAIESSTIYSNESSTVYSNESTTSYSNESSTFDSNDSSKSYSFGLVFPADWVLIIEELVFYCFYIFVSLGVVGNVLVITVVFCLRARRSTIDQFLAAIAISDTTYLLTSLCLAVPKNVAQVSVVDAHDVLCKGLIWTLNVPPALSAWLLVAMTTQRAMAVVWPHRVNVLCTGRRTWVIILALTLFFSLLYSPLLYGMEVYHYPNSDRRSCRLKNKSYKWFLYNVFIYIDSCLFSYIPAVCLLAGNAVLIFKLRQAGRDVGKTLADASSSSSAAQLHSRARDTQSISVTVIAVSLAFLVLTLPHTVFNMVNQGKATLTVPLILASSFTTTTVTLNYCINFYLYCLTGARFRNEFKRMVLCGASRGRQRRP